MHAQRIPPGNDADRLANVMFDLAEQLAIWNDRELFNLSLACMSLMIALNRETISRAAGRQEQEDTP